MNYLSLIAAIFVLLSLWLSLADLVPGVSDAQLIAKMRHELGEEGREISNEAILEHLRKKIEEHDGDKDELFDQIRKDIVAFTSSVDSDEKVGGEVS